MIQKIKSKVYTDRYYIYSVLVAVGVLIVGMLVGTVNNQNISTPLFPITIGLGLGGIWIFYFWAFFRIVKNNKDKFILKEPYAKNFLRKLYLWFFVLVFMCMYILIIISFLVSQDFSILIIGIPVTTIFMFIVFGLFKLFYHPLK